MKAQSKLNQFKEKLKAEMLEIETIQAACCASFGIASIKDLLNIKRKRHYANARFASIYLCKKLIPFLTTEDLARKHGYAECSPSITGANRAKILLEVDPAFKQAVERAERLVKGE